jgi:hypothetical protein
VPSEPSTSIAPSRSRQSDVAIAANQTTTTRSARGSTVRRRCKTSRGSWPPVAARAPEVLRIARRLKWPR